MENILFALWVFWRGFFGWLVWGFCWLVGLLFVFFLFKGYTAVTEHMGCSGKWLQSKLVEHIHPNYMPEPHFPL